MDYNNQHAHGTHPHIQTDGQSEKAVSGYWKLLFGLWRRLVRCKFHPKMGQRAKKEGGKKNQITFHILCEIPFEVADAL